MHGPVLPERRGDLKVARAGAIGREGDHPPVGRRAAPSCSPEGERWGHPADRRAALHPCRRERRSLLVFGRRERSERRETHQAVRRPPERPGSAVTGLAARSALLGRPHRSATRRGTEGARRARAISFPWSIASQAPARGAIRLNVAAAGKGSAPAPLRAACAAGTRADRRDGEGTGSRGEATG
jgi:hypothetical protein